LIIIESYEELLRNLLKLAWMEKKVDLYPYVTVEGTDGHTSWKKDNVSGFADYSGFDFHIDLGRLVKKGEPPLFDTLMHELMHDVIMIREYKKELSIYQGHSKPF